MTDESNEDELAAKQRAALGVLLGQALVAIGCTCPSPEGAGVNMELATVAHESGDPLHIEVRMLFHVTHHESCRALYISKSDSN